MSLQSCRYTELWGHLCDWEVYIIRVEGGGHLHYKTNTRSSFLLVVVRSGGFGATNRSDIFVAVNIQYKETRYRLSIRCLWRLSFCDSY